MVDYNLGPFRIIPRGAFDETVTYHYLEAVTYDGGSYVCVNNDTIDGEACTGILPVGHPYSESYWMCLAEKGETGDKAKYDNFIKLTDNTWDFNVSDKVIIPDDIDFSDKNGLNIINIYDGCCGIILTRHKDLQLPTNSNFSIDFGYVNSISDPQFYMYTFVYCDDFDGKERFIWHRTVINE